MCKWRSAIHVVWSISPCVVPIYTPDRLHSCLWSHLFSYWILAWIHSHQGGSPRESHEWSYMIYMFMHLILAYIHTHAHHGRSPRESHERPAERIVGVCWDYIHAPGGIGTHKAPRWWAHGSISACVDAFFGVLLIIDTVIRPAGDLVILCAWCSHA
jgi:hypothetical protein